MRFRIAKDDSDLHWDGQETPWLLCKSDLELSQRGLLVASRPSPRGRSPSLESQTIEAGTVLILGDVLTLSHEHASVDPEITQNGKEVVLRPR